MEHGLNVDFTQSPRTHLNCVLLTAENGRLILFAWFLSIFLLYTFFYFIHFGRLRIYVGRRTGFVVCDLKIPYWLKTGL